VCVSLTQADTAELLRTCGVRVAELVNQCAAHSTQHKLVWRADVFVELSLSLRVEVHDLVCRPTAQLSVVVVVVVVRLVPLCCANDRPAPLLHS
jgi:hypothetical protein